MKKQTSVIISIFLLGSLAYAAKPDGFMPGIENGYFNLGADFVCVDTDKYPDILLYPPSVVCLGWGGPAQIQNGVVVSDQAYVESTLLPGAGGDVHLDDINNDGKIDVVNFVESETETFSVFYNLGNRQFSSQQTLFSFPSFGPNFLVEKIIDVDGDGWPDIVCDASYYEGNDLRWKTIVFWNNNGNFSYDNRTEIPYTIWGYTANLNNDPGDKKDLILFNDDNTNTDTHNIEIYMQTTPRTFSLTNTYTGSGNGYQQISITTGDFNGDGYQDFIAIKFNAVGTNVFANEVELFVNNGDGSFTEIPVWIDSTMQYNEEALTTFTGCSMDIDGDGNQDFVLEKGGGQADAWVQIWYCVPLGNVISFETQIVASGSDVIPSAFGYVGDINNDGVADVVCGNTIYYGYKNSTTPFSNSGGGGGGGSVGPLSIALGILLGIKKHKGKCFV